MKIALIAGTGGLPAVLAASLVAQGHAPIICEMRGFRSEVNGDFERVAFRIETLATFLQTLQSLNVTEVCMAGAVQRPNVDPSAIDPATAPLVPRLMTAMTKGDDGTLREVITIFEEHGFTVLGAHEVAPDLLPIRGVHTKISPPDLVADIAAAQAAIIEMGQADQGQAMLLRDGTVIAREDARGTAAMLGDFCTPLIDTTERGGRVTGVLGVPIGTAVDFLSQSDAPTGSMGKGAILFKAPKPDQNLQADMPMIGPDTAMQAAEAGLAGIVIAHGGVMVLDLPQVISILDAQGMFLQVAP